MRRLKDSEFHDIEAELTFVRTEYGGRHGPATSGYRPQFYYDGLDWDAVHDYDPVEWVFPGQIVTAYLVFSAQRATWANSIQAKRSWCVKGSVWSPEVL